MSLAERGARGVHMGSNVVTYRRRIEPRRRLSSDRRRHREAYALLRRAHPDLFRSLPHHRRRSRLRPLQKLAYPVVYGRRPRLPFEPRLRHFLDRMGLGPDILLGRRRRTSG
jgi:hypothetical protein